MSNFFRGQVPTWVRSLSHVLAGIVFLSISAHFMLSAAGGWNALWRKIKQVPAQPAVPHSAGPKINTGADPDDVTDAARLQVYSVLPQFADSATAGSDTASAPQTPGSPYAVDHVHPSPDAGVQQFLRQRLLLRSYRTFSFIVPAHALRPSLHGAFKLLGGTRGGSAKVYIWLLTPQEYQSLLHDQGGTNSFFMEGSNGEVDWALPPALSAPQKYYLVFRNASNKSPSLVDVDFTFSLE